MNGQSNVDSMMGGRSRTNPARSYHRKGAGAISCRLCTQSVRPRIQREVARLKNVAGWVAVSSLHFHSLGFAKIQAEILPVRPVLLFQPEPHAIYAPEESLVISNHLP